MLQVNFLIQILDKIYRVLKRIFKNMSELKKKDPINQEFIKKFNITLPVDKRLWRENINVITILV